MTSETITTKEDLAEVFFQSTPCLASHVQALAMEQEQEYLKTVRFLCESGTFAVVSSGGRARIVAALHIAGQHKAISMVLPHCDAADIVKALTLLDRPRKARQLSKRILKIESDHPHVIPTDDVSEKDANTQDGDDKTNKKRRKRKVDVYRRKLRAVEAELNQEIERQEDETSSEAQKNTAVKELIDSASVSGALAKKVRRWARTNLKSDFLEFVLLAMPPATWRTLADLVHFSNSDFSLPTFLDDVHKKNNEPETGAMEVEKKPTFVACMKELTENLDASDLEMKFLRLAEEYPQVYLSYPFIRLHSKLLKSATIMESLARAVPLDTLIWYFEEFYSANRASEAILEERLKSLGDVPLKNGPASTKAATYGKLLERILTFKRMRLKKELVEQVELMAASKLETLKSYWQSRVDGDCKVAVYGDASSSMQSAIEAATIFAGMVSACFDGELSFFSSGLVESPYKKPKDVSQTLKVCDKIRANGCTSLAASLWPYFERRVFLDMIVLVTDEWENTQCNGYMFAPLLKKYKETVNPNVTLVVVCVGKGNRSFRTDLSNHGIDYKTVQIDESRPDLAKFDALLGQLALVSARVNVNSDTNTTVEDGNRVAALSLKEDEFVVV